MNTILVTGGAGFIGSNFVRYALGCLKDVHIVNLDKLTYAGNPANLNLLPAPARHVFIKGDICDRNLVEKIFSDYKPSSVINFAAESHVDRSILDATPFIKTNVEGVLVLMEIARKFWKEDSRNLFLQISTDEVYGSLGETGLFTEDTPLAPNSPYSASKASADLLVRSFCNTYGFPAIITRCSNNYGPYQFPEKLIPLTIANLMLKKEIPVYGDGKNVRDWIYVEDHCAAILTVLEKGKEGEVYNIGGQTEILNIDLVNMLCAFRGAGRELIKFVKDRPGHDRRYAMDITKIGRELGWRPSYTIKDGMKKTFEWYLENQKWWKDLL